MNSRAKSFLIIVAVMLAAFMQVLDMTIVSVAMPHMQGALSASPDQISWVFTSYLVASAIVMPLTGYFTDRLGQKNFLLLCTCGFVASSALCGLASSIAQIVFFRTLQGIFGAALIPLSQAIMVGLYPPEQRPRAMTIWGMCVMLGPVVGPALGGILTDLLSWRWTFYINIPAGALSLFLAWRLVPDTPTRLRQTNWVGFFFMALGIGCLQLLLDRGNQEDWFESRFIQVTALLSIVGFVGFFNNSLTAKHPVVRLEVFRDLNFAKACLFLGTFGVGLFDDLVLRPVMLENLIGYPATTVGMIQAPAGFGTMAGVFASGRLIGRFTTYTIVMIGAVLCTAGAYGMIGYDLTTSTSYLIWPHVLRGVGCGLIFTPLSTLAFSTLPKQAAAEAAGLYSFVRTITTSIGVSLTATIMTQHSQAAWQRLAGYVQPFNTRLESYFNQIHLTPTEPSGMLLVAQEMSRQAQMIGIIDGFILNAALFALLIPLAFLLRPRARLRAPSSVVEPQTSNSGSR